MQFDAAYQEEILLDDGTSAHIRLVRPEDKALIRATWHELSSESRYRRFLTSKDHLSDAELRYLTEIDQQDHFALGAETTSPSGPVGLGIARFIRNKDRPDTAEAAIVIADRFQGRGLGRALLGRLVMAARERGIAYFSCDVLASNEAMRQFLRDLVPRRVEHSDGETVEIEIPLGDIDLAATAPPVPVTQSTFYRLFQLMAQGALRLRKTLAEIEDKLPHPHSP